MNNLKKFLAFVVFAFVLTSCEKVLDLDLNAAATRYVIEGNITSAAGPYAVKITQTKNFSEDNTFPGVTNAVVTIADNAGNSETLSQTSPGIYHTTELAGVPGRTYQLTVNIGNSTFTATSTMPVSVPIDSLYVEELTGFGQVRKIPYIRYQDHALLRNYYRHVLYVNEERVNSLFISNDDFFDGQVVSRPLPVFGQENRLEQGDRILVEQLGLDKATYDYFYSLDQTMSQSAATPANPVSNIRGGALGYFSAHTITRKNLVVQ